MNEQTCPVCGTSVTGMKCPNCSFPLSGATAFADQTARDAWQTQELRAREAFTAREASEQSSMEKSGQAVKGQSEAQVRLQYSGSLHVGVNCGAFIDPRTGRLLEWDKAGRFMPQEGEYLSWSCSSGHYVRVRRDGRAEGIDIGGIQNGETQLSLISGAADALAADGVTYLVGADGTVQVIGTSEWRKALSEWTDIQMLSAGKYLIAGLTKAGTVRVAEPVSASRRFAGGFKGIFTADTPLYHSHVPSPDLANITQIACTAHQLLALDKDGKVWIRNGNQTVRRLDCGGQVVEVAANGQDENYLCLRDDGTVYIPGTSYAAAKDWKNVIAIANAPGLAAALTSKRKLLATGTAYAARKWKERFLPTLEEYNTNASFRRP